MTDAIADDVVHEFLLESHDNLDRLDQDLLALERGESTQEIIANVFRTVHTIKGTCGFLGFDRLAELTHVGENLLSRLRDGELRPTVDITSTLLDLVDAVRATLAHIEKTGVEPQRDDSALCARIQAHLAGEASAAPIEQVEARDPTEARSAVADAHVRIDVGVLDRLMDLVGELVLARNQILQFAGMSEEPTLLANSQRLDLITTELQEGIMKTRMQPIGNVWNRFPRVVRDVARACGKEVRLDTEGSDTELDRTIIEAIRDPLTHLVRNAIDHGIESPEDRALRGKPRQGVLLLRAYHEGGQVNIEISDDGRGIAVERVRERAIQRELVTRDQALRMSDREVLGLIFLPGFSTAEQVTNISGRGVGMDVVRSNVERIGGMVDVQSRVGHGTVVRIKIPLTLAIIPALIVTSGGERYALPQASLVELVRLERNTAAVETLFGTRVYRLRGNLLPLVFLDGLLGRARSHAHDDAINIVVVQADDRQFGLVVDDVSDTQEIVVKPLGKLLNGLSVFAGATILGDGCIALILDVIGLGQRAQVIREVRERASGNDERAALSREQTKTSLLVVSTRDDGRLALPLSTVARLEEFDEARVETIGDTEVVQYRGEIMPLVRVSQVLPERRSAPRAELTTTTTSSLQVVVTSSGGRSVGFVVDRIHDIVEEDVTVKAQTARRGVLGAAVIQTRVTELLDVHGLAARAAGQLDG